MGSSLPFANTMIHNDWQTCCPGEGLELLKATCCQHTMMGRVCFEGSWHGLKKGAGGGGVRGGGGAGPGEEARNSDLSGPLVICTKHNALYPTNGPNATLFPTRLGREKAP